jgi:isoaspartyl peptidase/L-asparaginase-like protein (Ntn-hydrolase superfamily)
MSEEILIAHGGAGNVKNKEAKDEVEVIAREGFDFLSKNNSEECVEKTVNLLESDPLYNAGYGSKLQLDGKPRPEAGIMTSDLSIGCAIGLDGIEKAVTVAKAVKNKLNNNIVNSPYSTQLGLQLGLNKKDLTTKKRVEEWLEVKEKMLGLSYFEKQEKLKELDKDSGTVGCVALDSNNNLCAATSTGGRTYQVAGRIGDTPLPGCGFYCNDEIAISTTGVGESIMKSQLAHRISVYYNNNNNLKEAVDRSLKYLEENTEGFAGVIAVTSSGDYYTSYNSEDMSYSIKKS